MKVICKCGEHVDMVTVDGQYQYTYEGTCPKCKMMWQLKDIITETDEEFLNIPAECRNIECSDCDVGEAIKRVEQDRAEHHRQKVNDAIQVVRENSPSLECPECTSDELDFLEQHSIIDSGIVTYEWQCSDDDCGCIFTEIFYRVLVEKVS